MQNAYLIATVKWYTLGLKKKKKLSSESHTGKVCFYLSGMSIHQCLTENLFCGVGGGVSEEQTPRTGSVT